MIQKIKEAMCSMWGHKAMTIYYENPVFIGTRLQRIIKGSYSVCSRCGKQLTSRRPR